MPRHYRRRFVVYLVNACIHCVFIDLNLSVQGQLIFVLVRYQMQNLYINKYRNI